MITGRGPGAPSVTPNTVLTLRQSAPDQTADLTAIRQTDALIDLLGSRRLRRPHTSGDPALILLSSLAADVDCSAQTGSADAAAVPAAAVPAAAVPAGAVHAGAGPAGAGHAGAAQAAVMETGARHGPGAADSLPAAERAAAAEWVHATAAAAVIAAAVALLAVAGLVVAGMVVRLTGMPARLWFRRPGGPGGGN